MIYIRNESTNPYFNLALEEYVLNHMNEREDYFLLWQNEPSIIIGKHQNTLEEINLQFVKKNNIHVVRRLSGGGAVYHDLGNLNFTFVVKNCESSQFNFKKFTEPVIRALENLGIQAAFNSRNDLTIEGKKFSGNAQYMKKDRLLHHGTLLFSSELEQLVKALHVSDEKIISKGIKSIRSRVTNISDYLDQKVSIQQFKELLLRYMFHEELQEYTLTEEEMNEVKEMMEKRYLTWEWNYGESPKFNIKKERRFEGGKVEALLDIEGGIIESCKIYGDFFSNGDIHELEKKLLGIKYQEESLKNCIENLEVGYYLNSISKEELLSLLML
ncbi:lipoate-protein ligase A [Anaerosolibacter carboniphilus]|uniref:lipoate--protein ligase n=1 Tax=Anaerosolibacter carboniphilus TaxID=1417629 RepID=A0A841KVN3_9FIRM|nr:lipoate--protein ligase [Anaerosolibacter carboniphilus]MBB6217427.1 lipoate-protein ligase A [Anaerosolibacter carboniphilus]